MAPRTKKTEETKEVSAVEIKKPVRKTAVKKASEKKAADNKSETVPEVKKRGRKPKTETAAVPEKAVAAVPAETQGKTETESVKTAPVRRITKRVLKTKRLIEKEKSVAEEKLAETAFSVDASADMNTDDAAKAANTERHGRF